MVMDDSGAIAPGTSRAFSQAYLTRMGEERGAMGWGYLWARRRYRIVNGKLLEFR